MQVNTVKSAKKKSYKSYKCTITKETISINMVKLIYKIKLDDSCFT